MLKIYRDIDFDSAEVGNEALERMLNKKCLYDIYKETYDMIMACKNQFLNTGDKVLEIGSGGGFIKKLYPNVITSDVRNIDKLDMIIDARQLPFDDNYLDAVIATHVLHHIPDVELFFKECERVIKPGGGMVFVEPYWGPFAKFLYKHVHPEPFDEKAKNWKLDSTGPMSGSNQALSYILLKRDKDSFINEFPNFEIKYQKPFNCLRYVATGGIWLKQKLPNFMFPVLKRIEGLMTPIMPIVGIHHIFVIKIKN